MKYGLLIALSLVLVVIWMFMSAVVTDATLIGSGPVQEFEMVNAPLTQYDIITVEITAEQVSGALAPTAVWYGVIPKDAQFYNVTLTDGDTAYSLLLTIREDGIGCMPTDYPYALTMQIYGVK